MKKLTSTIAPLVAITVLGLGAFAPASAADDAVYRGLGGKAGIKKIVDDFVPLLLSDPRIKESFADSDAKQIHAALSEQFCALAGGPCTYGGEPMKEVHAGLKITNAQFNALTEDLQIAMENNGVAPSVANKLVAKLAPMQREIVTK
ncbi:group I truncated hemoglobin [Massilia sp. DWR3-1-1]|uniref:group I truncated hemoglobin n=1 Tax=Massilia sp. DWR3-1-1 TaxID=2804559 RepID=UPI003CF46BDA